MEELFGTARLDTMHLKAAVNDEERRWDLVT